MLFLLSWTQTGKPISTYYQLTVYHYTSSEQEKMLDDYLEKAFIPAMHKLKIKTVGVFKAIANDTATLKKLYVLIPVRSLDVLEKLPARLADDQDYQTNGAAYINAIHTAPAYTRMETIILKAFSLAPSLQLPVLKADKKERVYELRSYESATEKIFRNKVKMFNEGGEIAIFKKLNFNAIFYSEVIAGGKMPNLVYMTSFENMADRDAHWKSFGSDPDWKTLSASPEYKNNVSHIDIMFLRPAAYSDY
jgi:hypothetical protein